jgi:hypothetical protein
MSTGKCAVRVATVRLTANLAMAVLAVGGVSA